MTYKHTYTKVCQITHRQIKCAADSEEDDRRRGPGHVVFKGSGYDMTAFESACQEMVKEMEEFAN